jgi:fatty-acyl-CoA synthase
MTNDHGVGTWIERRARVAPDQVALVHGDTRRTYAELAGRVRRLARGLEGLGVRRGDRIGWLGSNHPAFLESLFAAATLGAVLTPINHRLEPDAIEAICEDAAPRVLLLDGSLTGLRLPTGLAANVAVGRSGQDEDQYEELIAGAPDEPVDRTIALDDLCLLPFTSGTTGPPKGVMLTHANVTWNVINCLSAIGFRSDDVTIATAPFFRTGGTGVNVLPVLFKGGTVVIPRTTDPHETFDLVERHRVTIGFGNPDLLDTLTRSPRWRAARLTSLRAFVTGGAPVPERLLHACHERGVNVLQGYGLSEAAPLVSVLDAPNALRKIGSAGRPAPFVDVRIAGHHGSAAVAGEIGELLVRGPNVMAGYWNRPDGPRRPIDEGGWLRTGDAARIDDEGFLFIVGRIEDAYLSSGKVVHPGVVERVLLQHAAVREACILGGDDGAVAHVVLAAGTSAEVEAELLSLCAGRLAVHERPARIEFVASLPRNPAGKIMRHRLRRQREGAARWEPHRLRSRVDRRPRPRPAARRESSSRRRRRCPAPARTTRGSR